MHTLVASLRNPAIAALAALCFATGPASALADRTTGETIDDSTIASSVKVALLEDDEAPGTSINVEAYKGNVQLIGFVRTDAEEASAIAAAAAVDGVASVTDAIVVVPEKRSFGTSIDDQTVQTKVKLAITEVSASAGLAVVTDVRNGAVLLGGFVESESQHRDIIAATEGVAGVTRVHDFIAAREPAPEEPAVLAPVGEKPAGSEAAGHTPAADDRAADIEPGD